MRVSALLCSGDDDIARDNITVYDSIVFDKDETDIKTSLSVPDELYPMESHDCHTDCTTVERPLQTFSGYVDIKYKTQQ